MNHPTARDVEVYAFISDPNAVARTLAGQLGEWRTAPSASDEILRYEVGDVVLLLQRSAHGSLSVWLRGSDRWPTSAALARFLVQELGCEVRCEPAPEHPIDAHSNVFLRITRAGEELVEWE